MHDILIKGGLLVDGTGAPPRRGDVAITDERISAVGTDLGPARETLDATGCIVTPGFIDLHTHYDGQVSWDDELKPSVNHGVTTAVMGNCGVGFAPCRAEDRDRLIRLMEGVEDIPGTALHEGMDWQWESVPEYLDALDAMPRTIDVAAMVPHDPLRVYVMGERAVHDQPATPADIARMREIVAEALAAGAVGFATGRSDAHKTSDGEWTPTSEATVEELTGIADAVASSGHGVLQAVNDFDMVRPEDNFDAEWDLMRAFFEAGRGRPHSMSLMQRDFAPQDWRKILDRASRELPDLQFQVAPRAIGVMQGLDCTFHPLMAFPSYIEISTLSLPERVAKMRDPAFRAQLLSETPVKISGEGTNLPPMVDMLIAGFEMVSWKMFELGRDGRVDYAQTRDSSIGARAQAEGVSVWETTYDLLLQDNGHALIYFPIYNYTDFTYGAVLEMLKHPRALPGLSDGGAHVGTICDASFPTYLLQHWVRDTHEIPLERAVQMLTADGADYIGFPDRGRLKAGLRADVNVIDLDQLGLGVPRMVQDLPGGGQRLLQPVTGYRATYVAGSRVIDHDQVTSQRPGRLVRGGQFDTAIAAE